jgi:NADH:ubiquinone oxidoreductase subunit 6 (subunit J)
VSRHSLAPRWPAWIVHGLWILTIVSVVWQYCTGLLPYTHDPNGKFNVDAGWRLYANVLLYVMLAPVTLLDAVVGALLWRRCRTRGQRAHPLWKALTLAAAAVLVALTIIKLASN